MYDIKCFYQNEWRTLVRFTAEVPYEVMENAAVAIANDPIIPYENIVIVDLLNDEEVIWHLDIFSDLPLDIPC